MEAPFKGRYGDDEGIRCAATARACSAWSGNLTGRPEVSDGRLQRHCKPESGAGRMWHDIRVKNGRVRGGKVDRFELTSTRQLGYPAASSSVLGEGDHWDDTASRLASQSESVKKRSAIEVTACCFQPLSASHLSNSVRSMATCSARQLEMSSSHNACGWSASGQR